MPNQPSRTVIPGLSPEQVKGTARTADDFRTVFTNHIRVAASQTEFRLFLGESYPTPTNEVRVIEHLCAVMTPAQAKSTAEILSRAVKEMETAFGVIGTLGQQESPKAKE